MADIDIEFAICASGTYTISFKDKNNPAGVVVTGFTGGTISFAADDALETVLGSATLINFGTPDAYSCQFVIPPSHSMTVGDRAYRDYSAQAVLTGNGTRLTRLLSVRIHKKIGVAT